MYKSGRSSAEGVKRKGKRSANSFVAVPWAAKAKAYLPGIKTLTAHKWGKIVAMSSPYIDTSAQIELETEDESGEDSRGLIVVSDDSDSDSVSRC